MPDEPGNAASGDTYRRKRWRTRGAPRAASGAGPSDEPDNAASGGTSRRKRGERAPQGGGAAVRGASRTEPRDGPGRSA